MDDYIYQYKYKPVSSQLPSLKMNMPITPLPLGNHFCMLSSIHYFLTQISPSLPSFGNISLLVPELLTHEYIHTYIHIPSPCHNMYLENEHEKCYPARVDFHVEEGCAWLGPCPKLFPSISAPPHQMLILWFLARTRPQREKRAQLYQQ